MIPGSGPVPSVDAVIWVVVSVLGLVVETAMIVVLGRQVTGAYEERSGGGDPP